MINKSNLSLSKSNRDSKIPSFDISTSLMSLITFNIQKFIEGDYRDNHELMFKSLSSNLGLTCGLIRGEKSKKLFLKFGKNLKWIEQNLDKVVVNDSRGNPRYFDPGLFKQIGIRLRGCFRLQMRCLQIEGFLVE